MPKNRQTIFCVIREEAVHNTALETIYGKPIVCAATFSLERAEELRGRYEQEMKERGFDFEFSFEVRPTTYYEE